MDKADPRGRRPVSAKLMCDVIIDVVRKLRAETEEKILGATNDLRRDLNMPAVKQRVRVPVTRGQTW